MAQNTEELMEEVLRMNTNHRYNAALKLLDTIEEKNAKWYYAGGYANSCLGNNIIAQEMMAKAVEMDPENAEYRRLLNHLNSAPEYYQNSDNGTGVNTVGKNKKDDGCLLSTCLCCCCWPSDDWNI